MSDYSKLSREVELSGLKRLQDFYGKHATVKDRGSTPSYDFEILHSNGSLGIGDFAWLQDEVRMSAWVALTKQDQHHLIPLKSGSGFWALSIENESRINNLYRKLPNLIEKMLTAGIMNYEVYETWPRDEIAQECRDLGIIYIYNTGRNDQDKAFFLLKGSGGYIPNDLDPLARRVEELLEGKFRDCWTKLASTQADEKHIYLKLGFLIPFNLADTLMTNRDPVEISNISFPDGISHIWLEGNGEHMRNVLWRLDDTNTYF